MSPNVGAIDQRLLRPTVLRFCRGRGLDVTVIAQDRLQVSVITNELLRAAATSQKSNPDWNGFAERLC
jgi:hypothetical protein